MSDLRITLFNHVVIFNDSVVMIHKIFCKPLATEKININSTFNKMYVPLTMFHCFTHI